ncbi:MAG: hypothetical protein MR675_10520 [Lachnospira sp.]|nr:hypothetical protein [Lachnospira sp.]
MKRNKYKDYLWYTALAVFIICVIEGIFFYHNVENPFLKVTLNIQNAIKAYKIDPDIKQAEALAYMQKSEGGVLSGIITYAYCLAVIVAPFCTIGALAVLIRKPASYIRGFFNQRNKKSVLVIGEGKYQFAFIDALTKDCRVTVVESSVLSEENKLKYINKGVKFVQKYGDMSLENVFKLVNIRKFNDIFLCDENALENIEYLKVLSSKSSQYNGGGDTSYQQIHLVCTDNSMAELIRQYYDNLDIKSFDLNIVDVNKMAVNKMYKEHPVYTANKDDNYDVHIGIIGFGDFGQSALIQGLNVSVLSADSKICVDVFDKDIDSIIGGFMKNFSVDALDGLRYIKEDVYEGKSTGCYELKMPFNTVPDKFGMDGEINIRFFNTDARTLQFNKIFKKCNVQNPFTYLIVAMSDTRSMANTIIELKQLLYNKGDACINIPVIVRVKENNDFANIYGEKNLFTINRDRDIYAYDSITNQEITNEAKLFNHRYNLLYSVISDYKKDKNTVIDDNFMLEIEKHLKEDALKVEKDMSELNKVWHKMSIFDRESSIAQSLHQDVKKWLVYDRKTFSLKDDKEELEKIEHRRWNVFMITHGFKYERSERKDLYAKTHPCISKWEVLKVEKPDTLEYDYTPYYILKMNK